MLKRLFGAPKAPASHPGDAAVLAQMVKAGSDLKKEHEIENFLYVPDEAAAKAAAARLEGLGYRTLAQESATPIAGLTWLVMSYFKTVPTVPAIASIRAQQEALAAELRGDYDGWGTPIVK